MASFLAKVAENILEDHPDLSGTLIILPARRSAVFLRREISGRLKKPLLAPLLTTIEEFFLDSLGWEQESRHSLLFQLYEEYLKLDIPEKDEFSEFLKWGPNLLNDFNEIDRYMADASQLFTYLSDVKRIQQWDLSPGESADTDMIKSYLKFWERLHIIYNRFTQKLEAQKRVYQGLAFRRMAEKMDEILPEISKRYDRFIFVGFSALNKAEEECLIRFQREGKADFYWDIDDYYFSDPMHEAGKFLRQSKLLQELKQRDKLKWIGNKLGTSSKNLRIISAAGDNLQMMAAHEELLKLKESQPEEIAVVLADENSLPPFLNHLPEGIKELNITMGLPLRETAVAGFLQAIWNLQTSWLSHRRTLNGQPVFHHRLWDNFLSQAICSQIFSAGLIGNIRSKIRKENRVFISAREVFEEAENYVLFQDFFEDNLNPAGFCRSAAKLCEELKSILLDDAYEKGILYSFYQIFRQSEQLFTSYNYVSDLKTAQQFYQELLREKTLDLRGEPLQGLQIMGMLETRTLGFKNIILTSVNEEILPQGKSFSGLIPFDIKLQFGLPTYLDKDSVYAYHFYRLLQEADNISIIYNSSSGSMGSAEASRFIYQLKYELARVNKNINLQTLVYSGKLHLPDTPEEVVKTESLLERLKEMAVKGFSPTSLLDYLRDPLKFYYTRVLGLRETEEVEETAGFQTQGKVVHQMLEKYFSYEEDLSRGAVGEVSFNLPALRRKEEDIRQEVQLTLREFGLHNPEEGKNLLIRETLTAMLRNYLNRLRTEIKESSPNWKVLALEQHLEHRITLSDGREIIIKGVADRIDMRDGVPEIIDYKTGKAEKKEVSIRELNDLRKIERGKAFQLLVYSWLYMKNYPETDKVKAGIISLRNVAEGTFYCSWDKTDTFNSEMLNDFEGFLKEILEEIFNPEINFSEKILTLEDED